MEKFRCKERMEDPLLKKRFYKAFTIKYEYKGIFFNYYLGTISRGMRNE